MKKLVVRATVGELEKNEKFKIKSSGKTGHDMIEKKKIKEKDDRIV